MKSLIVYYSHSGNNEKLWAMKMPDPQGFGEGVVELRQVFE